MKVLLINGSPHARGCTYTALCEVEKSLQNRGVETKLFQLGTKPIAGCIACGSCAKTGQCVCTDAVNELGTQLDEFDGIVVGSPVYYAGPAGQLCAFLDRFFYCNGSRMAGKFGAAVVSCRRGGASAAFDRLNKYFTLCNMPVVPSQYWNQVHGSQPQDVLQDAEGLQTMRTLGENMAWLLQSKQAAQEAQVPLPHYEPRLRTNFIR